MILARFQPGGRAYDPKNTQVSGPDYPALVGAGKSGYREHPGSGGLVAVANHVSYWDPVVKYALLSAGFTHGQGRSFQNSCSGLCGLHIRAFPVRGTTDRNAIRTALKLLKEGQVVGCSRGYQSQRRNAETPPWRSNACAQNGVPVYPLRLAGQGVLGQDQSPCGQTYSGGIIEVQLQGRSGGFK